MMSWLSDVFSDSSAPQIVPPTATQVANYYKDVKANNPAYYETIKANDPDYIASQQAAAYAAPAAAAAAAPVSVAPTGPEVALKQLNDTLGSGFESRYLPDTLDDPFINTALTSGRSKADEFIQNMLKRGVLNESGRGNAVKALDTQTGGITSKLNALGSALISSDRANLTNLANQKRAQAQGTPVGTEFDPTPLVNEIASTGQGYAGSFGTRFNASLPPGDLYDTSGIGAASGAVTGPQNVSYDPYAVEGGQLSTGLDDQAPAVPAEKKRRTTVF